MKWLLIVGPAGLATLPGVACSQGVEELRGDLCPFVDGKPCPATELRIPGADGNR